MYSNFLRSWIHRQSVITENVLDQKKNSSIEGPPLCIQMCSSSLKPMQIPSMLHHGGNLKLWHDMCQFLVSLGYIATSPQRIDDNHEHHCNSNEFISSSLLAPIFPTRSSLYHTSTPCKCGRATSTHCTVCFLSNIVPQAA